MKWVVPLFAVTPLVDRPPAAGRKLADVVLGNTRADSGFYVHRTKVMAPSKESYSPDPGGRTVGVVGKTMTTGD
jgi:hypothetical protein